MKKKIAIFCDSEFWHGKFFQDGKTPKNNEAYWEKKFLKNIQRDEEVNDKLKSDGWIVLRFWEADIKKDVNEIATFVEATVALTR